MIKVKLDLDLDPDPDPHKMNADPQPCSKAWLMLSIGIKCQHLHLTENTASG